MEDEITALRNNDTWSLVGKAKNVNVVSSKRIFKTKLREDRIVDRFKARLVAQGYSRVHGLDYEETFSPVVKPTTIHLILALAVLLKWSLQQLDAKNAFFHGFLKEIIYMEQPLGFKDPIVSYDVCKLNRSIYGLKLVP